jgi:septal ring-binding cell division protein DamX
MASGGRRTAGERVLESKHVIGLFLIMLLFSGVFFTLGYVMGRNQYDAQVRASAGFVGKSEPAVLPKSESSPRKSVPPVTAPSETDPATPSSNSEWEFYGNNKPAKSEPHLEPAPKTPGAPSSPKTSNSRERMQPQPVSAPARSLRPTATAPPVTGGGAYLLQVAALLKQDDALAVANSLQKKHYPCYVQPPQRDKYYRVQVGPFKDRVAADTAKKGLEDEGFNAFYVKR